MFHTLSSIKKPNKSFNLLHLESQEVYFLTIRASLIINIHNEEIKGKIHLCSRSLIFEPTEINHPLIKLKYSNNIMLKLFKNLNSQKLDQLLKTQLNIQQINEQTLDEELFQNMANPQIAKDIKQQKKLKFEIEDLLQKLYLNNDYNKDNNQQQQQQQQNYFSDKLTTCFLIRVEKVFIIHRNPISPYITEKTTDNFIFSIAKSNTKAQIYRFLKIYDGFIKTPDESKFIDYVIYSTLMEGVKELKELKKHNNQQILILHKAQKITTEGPISGIFTITQQERHNHSQGQIINQKIGYYSLVNCIDNKNWEFNISDVKAFLKYRYMFKHTAIEIWFYNKKRSILINFSDNKTQDQVYNTLLKICTKANMESLNIQEIQNQWVEGKITNFDYLMYLNTMANRSFNDISAYPVFPWVIDDYQINQDEEGYQELDLDNPQIYRDLSKPIGAINKHRLQKLRQFYEAQLKEKSKNQQAYLYPTHYSSPGLVVYYLIRKIPEFVIKLQNGVFGPTDRIFRSVQSTWYAALNLDADFKELIPEFFFSDGDFLVNNEKLELGVTNEGDNIDDVVLPPWAKNIHEFMSKNRAALESNYVSQHLNQWIDLIFGFKSQGQNAKNSDNLFYPQTYEKNVNWDQYTSNIEKQAMEVQVMEFGQTPVQLFNKAHPQRKIKASIVNNSEIQNIAQDQNLINKYMQQCQDNERLQQDLERVEVQYQNQLERQEEDFGIKLGQKQKELEKNKEKYTQQIQNLLNLNTDTLDQNLIKNPEEVKTLIARQNLLIEDLQKEIQLIKLENQQLQNGSQGLQDLDSKQFNSIQIQNNEDHHLQNSDIFNPLSHDQHLDSAQKMNSKDFDFLNNSEEY